MFCAAGWARLRSRLVLCRHGADRIASHASLSAITDANPVHSASAAVPSLFIIFKPRRSSLLAEHRSLEAGAWGFACSLAGMAPAVLELKEMQVWMGCWCSSLQR